MGNPNKLLKWTTIISFLVGTSLFAQQPNTNTNNSQTQIKNSQNTNQPASTKTTVGQQKTNPNKPQPNNTPPPKRMRPKPQSAAPKATATQQQSSPAKTSAPAASNSQPKQQAKKQEAEAKESTEKSETKSEEPSSEAKEGESDGGFSFSGGLAVGMMTKDGEQVTRLSYRPEISMGPLGVALDLELFFSSTGKIQSDGWEFDTKDEIINTLYRKIYYVRWNQPGDGFYIRAGAIEGVNLDAASLITNNYGNIAKYPGQKLVGIHTQINNFISPYNISLEVVNNSLEDWSHQGGVLGARASFTPLGGLPLPIISNLKIGGTMMGDYNQYATVSDKDDDGCPDAFDLEPKNALVCAQLTREEINELPDTTMIRDFPGFDSLKSESIAGRYSKADKFGMWAIDLGLPIIQTDILQLGVYSEYAQPLSNGHKAIDTAYALVPLGAYFKLSILSVGAQYRILNGNFIPGHFNANYEMERTILKGDSIETKESTYWLTGEDPGQRKGIYGNASIDLGGFIVVGGSYSHLISDNGPALRSMGAFAEVGQSVLSFIPKINKAMVFAEKNKIGLDRYDDSDGEEIKDSFFAKSIYMSYGYLLGFEMGGGMNVHVKSLNTFYRDEDNKLQSQPNFTVETVFVF